MWNRLHPGLETRQTRQQVGDLRTLRDVQSKGGIETGAHKSPKSRFCQGTPTGTGDWGPHETVCFCIWSSPPVGTTIGTPLHLGEKSRCPSTFAGTPPTAPAPPPAATTTTTTTAATTTTTTTTCQPTHSTATATRANSGSSRPTALHGWSGRIWKTDRGRNGPPTPVHYGHSTSVDA